MSLPYEGDLRKQHLLVALPDGPLSLLLRFLSTNDLLALRTTGAIARNYLENSKMWTWMTRGTSLGVPEWCLSRARTSFERFCLSRRILQSWSPLNQKRSSSSFEVEVFARVKGGEENGGRGPSHLLCDESSDQITLLRSPIECWNFQLTKLLSSQASQRQVFETVMGRFLLDAACGLSSTVFLYGQTGSGKTHTCLGGTGKALDGIIPETMREIFTWEHRTRVELRVLEVYCEKVSVLVEATQLTSYESGAIPILQWVMDHRRVRANGYNDRSSRSHVIFSIRITLSNGLKRLASTLNIVDLAGAERQREDVVTPQQKSPGRVLTDEEIAENKRALVVESSKINQSLTTLGRVIRALSEPSRQHVPYRDSQLTLLLSASLGGPAVGEGNTSSGRTAFVLTLSSEDSDWRETLATLRFGEAARKVCLERSSSSSATSYGSKMLAEYSKKLWKVNAEMHDLETVWQSCGAGRHDPLCRCDRCLNRAEHRGEAFELPLHIPKYVALTDKKREYERLLEECRLAMLGAFSNGN